MKGGCWSYFFRLSYSELPLSYVTESKKDTVHVEELTHYCFYQKRLRVIKHKPSHPG